MSEFKPCQIEIHFADGEYLFKLTLPQLAELQEKCGGGMHGALGRIYARLLAGLYEFDGERILNAAEAAFDVRDIYETIRLGLIGGGKGIVNGEEVVVGPIQAKMLCERYVLGRPIGEGHKIAAAVIGACVQGFEPPKDATPPKKVERAKATKTDASTTPAPSATAPKSASRRKP